MFAWEFVEKVRQFSLEARRMLWRGAKTERPQFVETIVLAEHPTLGGVGNPIPSDL